jgi:D-alanyl-D-alanine carboxypeptidase
MSLRNFLSQSNIWQFPYWLFGTLLYLIIGPALANEYLISKPKVAARAAVLMNAKTGQILFAKEPDLRLPPASTTKVLTALLVVENLSLDSQISVSQQAANAPPSRIGLHAGETASTHDLLYGLLLKSGNDAAEALAEAAGGSIYGFSNLMNDKVWQIGARNSHFMNPHGLPNEHHYSTAYDLALIFRHAMQNPIFADIVRTRSAALRIDSGRGNWYSDGRLIPVHNTNRLLESYEGTRGGKTGFTIKARRCFVGEVDREGVQLIVSIMNSPNSGTLWQDARILFDYGFTSSGTSLSLPMQTAKIQPYIFNHRSIAARTLQGYPSTLAAINSPTTDSSQMLVSTTRGRHATVTQLAISHAVKKNSELVKNKETRYLSSSRRKLPSFHKTVNLAGKTDSIKALHITTKKPTTKLERNIYTPLKETVRHYKKVSTIAKVTGKGAKASSRQEKTVTSNAAQSENQAAIGKVKTNVELSHRKNH